MANEAPQAVVFDLDGLMFNTEELYIEVGTEVLRRRGFEFTLELMDAMMGFRHSEERKDYDLLGTSWYGYREKRRGH